ncbi:UNVERIFIED_CONTAM: choline dehydrogenase 7 [Siphonaria sp. JEL0065]|nr:choline dehydrogenase 7 [Siphonaria sp. JEL0065]
MSDSDSEDLDMLADAPARPNPLDYSSPLSDNSFDGSSSEEDDRDELVSEAANYSYNVGNAPAKKITLKMAAPQSTKPVYDSDSLNDDDDEASEASEEIDEFDNQDFTLDDEDEEFSKKKKKAGLPSSSTSGKKQKKASKKEKHSDKISTHRKPKSDVKTVPHDIVVIPMGDKSAGIDKLLSWRAATVEGGEEEVLVKYKNMSYVHCEWLPRSVVEADRMGKMRLQKFLAKPLWESHWSEDEPFNPSFKLIDRVIDDGDRDGELHYLVKWCSQTYDMSTWEPSSILEELDGSKILEFYDRKEVNAAKYTSFQNQGKRPSSKEWSKMDESPVYKNDNQLRPYQLEGLNWLLFCWYHNQNSILADEMGLGKTVQSTVFLDYLFTRCNIKGPFLVIAPLSVIGNWEREIQRWSEMNVVVYHGRETARNLIVETEFYYRDANHEIVADIYKFDVVLTTYEMAMSGMSQLRPINWRCVVLDEAHRLKNKASKISEVLKQYKMEHRVLLTGTPLQNSLDELWALLNFLQPEKFGSERDFQRDYGNLASASDVEKLQALLKPLMLRRLKEDVEKSIPIKEETIIEVELTTMQKKWYKSILERNFTWLKQGADKRSNMPNLINAMMELRKCCIHPFLLNGAEDAIIQEYNADTPEKQFSALVQASGKMVLIDKLLRKLKQGGHKVLIFSQMTRCLDLIQDYLRGQQWGFERIDGGVRGDLRQAAIDRFSAPGCETFVFLLCTRAGGVGINLTAADTVIIFDSDWNPQNDLQAQSRVHRIGQKKSVLIYRLITRNTYEREMFDKASMKLGLDKAILQRMDANSAFEPESDSKKVTGMSKTEIEDLLKKGAYAAFMDDNAANDFCEEDIDQILTRRTQVIRHDNPAEKSSIFSKATFATSEELVDINDPEFWDKVAKKAELNIVEVSDTPDLILDTVRMRKQVQRFGDQFTEDQDLGAGDDNFDPTVEGARRRDGNQPRLWSQADRLRLERCLMTFGYSRWDRFIDICRGRSVNDLKACSQSIVQFVLTTNSVDPDVVEDVKAWFALDGIDIQTADLSVPYTGATKRQIAEYRSCFLEAAKEHHEYMARKAKNLLLRLQMLYNIREKINPNPESRMPLILGAPLTHWWGDDEDRDLLIGTLNHGYGKYAEIASDPTLVFASRLAALDAENPLPSLTMAPPVDASVPNGASSGVSSERKMEGTNGAGVAVNESGEPVADGPKPDVEMGDGDDLDADDAKPVPGGAAVRLDLLPSPSDLGLRIRKIIAAFLRNQITVAREEQKKQLLEERAKARLEKEEERVKLKEKELTKRDRLEFYRTLSSYGVESDKNSRGVRDWTRFKEISQLKKAPEVLEEYFGKLMTLCKEVVSPTPGKPPLTAAEMDFITIDKAKKLIKRVESMTKLREDIINSPYLDTSILVLRTIGRSGLPEWWSTEHDKAYLIGIAKWGLNRGDLYVEDDTLPFKAIYEHYLQTREGTAAIQPGRLDDRFWMKEAVAMKRFYSLCDCVLDPTKKRGSGGNRRPVAAKKTGDDLDSDIDEMDDDLSAIPMVAYNPPVKRSARAKAVVAQPPVVVTVPPPPPVSSDVVDTFEQIRLLQDEISQVVAGVKRKRSKKKHRGSDNEDETEIGPDGIIVMKKHKKKHKKKHGHDEEDDDASSDVFAGGEVSNLLDQQSLVQQQEALLAGLADFTAASGHKKKKKHKKSSHHEDEGVGPDLAAIMSLAQSLVGDAQQKKSKKHKKHKKHQGEDYSEPGFLSDVGPHDAVMGDAGAEYEL